MNDVTRTSKEPFFVGYLRAYATYFRKPHEQREMGIRDSYLLSCAEEMERAADEIERLRATLEPPAEPVAWRKFIDSAYERHPRYTFREDTGIGAPEGWEPLYAAPPRPSQPPTPEPGVCRHGTRAPHECRECIAEDVIRTRAFWSRDRKELISAYVSDKDITLMDDNGHILEPAGDEQRHGPSPTKGEG